MSQNSGLSRIKFDMSALDYKSAHKSCFNPVSVLFSQHESRPQDLPVFGTRKCWLRFDIYIFHCTRAFKFNNGFGTCLEGITAVPNAGSSSDFKQKDQGPWERDSYNANNFLHCSSTKLKNTMKRRQKIFIQTHVL